MRLRGYENISSDVKSLMAQLNHEQFKLGNVEAANWAARQSRQEYERIADFSGKVEKGGDRIEYTLPAAK